VSTPEPGLDLHEWESEYASLEDGLRDDPVQGLPLLADLVERMLRARGIDLEEPDEDELAAEYRAARELSDAAERGEAGLGDVGAAIESLRTIYATIIAEYAPP
jgi:hypothetical protein